MEDEFVRLVEPDVHGPYGPVGEGSDAQLLSEEKCGDDVARSPNFRTTNKAKNAPEMFTKDQRKQKF